MSYVRSGMGRASRLAGAHRVSGLGRLRGRRLGQDITDYTPIITTAINDAASVAQVALRPPTYSSVVNPLTGASTVTSYGAIPSTSLLGTSSLGTLFSDPTFLLLGFGLLAVVLAKR